MRNVLLRRPDIDETPWPGARPKDPQDDAGAPKRYDAKKVEDVMKALAVLAERANDDSVDGNERGCIYRVIRQLVACAKHEQQHIFDRPEDRLWQERKRNPDAPEDEVERWQDMDYVAAIQQIPFGAMSGEQICRTLFGQGYLTHLRRRHMTQLADDDVCEIISASGIRVDVMQNGEPIPPTVFLRNPLDLNDGKTEYHNMSTRKALANIQDNVAERFEGESGMAEPQRFYGENWRHIVYSPKPDPKLNEITDMMLSRFCRHEENGVLSAAG